MHLCGRQTLHFAQHVVPLLHKLVPDKTSDLWRSLILHTTIASEMMQHALSREAVVRLAQTIFNWQVCLTTYALLLILHPPHSIPYHAISSCRSSSCQSLNTRTYSNQRRIGTPTSPRTSCSSAQPANTGACVSRL